MGVRVVALEFLDIADRRAAEGINGLVRITHHGELAAATALLADEGGDQHVLRVVGVLILVDEHVPEATAVVLRDLRVSAQDADDLADQVIEVHGVRRPEALLIIRVQGGDGLLVEVAVRVASAFAAAARRLVLQLLMVDSTPRVRTPTSGCGPSDQ